MGATRTIEPLSAAEIDGIAGLWKRGGREFVIDFVLRIRVQHEDLSEVRPAMTEHLQAVFLRSRHGVFVAEYNALGVVLHFPQTNEALPREVLV